MNPFHIAWPALVGWALLVPQFIKTCPESGPCTYPPVVGRSMTKAVYLTQQVCEEAASKWQADLNQRLAEEGKRKVGPEHAACKRNQQSQASP
jgi:hypothetical protein